MTRCRAETILAVDEMRTYIIPCWPFAGRARVQRYEAVGARWARGRTVSVQLMDPPMSNAISVTPDNVETILADLPRIARLAVTFGSRLRRGTLAVTLP